MLPGWRPLTSTAPWRGDTLVPFLRRACGRWAIVRAAVAAAARVVAMRSRWRSSAGCSGLAAARLDELGRAYVPTLLPRCAESRDRLEWHRRQGHAVVIVSASLGAYLRPLADRLGIDDALAVELVADAAGTLTGEVVGGLNTRGPEKVARLGRGSMPASGPGPTSSCGRTATRRETPSCWRSPTTPLGRARRPADRVGLTGRGHFGCMRTPPSTLITSAFM